jgi:hypothetical protein
MAVKKLCGEAKLVCMRSLLHCDGSKFGVSFIDPLRSTRMLLRLSSLLLLQQALHACDRSKFGVFFIDSLHPGRMLLYLSSLQLRQQALHACDRHC